MSEWKKVRLGDVCRIEKGVTGIASAEPGVYPLVVTAVERKTCSSYQFDCAAVCIPLVSSKGHGVKALNNVHYQEGKFALGTILCAVIPKNPEELSARYLHQYLQFNKDRVLVPLMKGAANVSLAVKDIASVEIPVPSIDNQKYFADLLNKVQLKGAEIQQEFEKQKDILKKLRQSVLQDAIEGKLTEDWRLNNPVIKNNVDYDVDFLTNKIQEEKQKIVKKKNDFVDVSNVSFFVPKSWKWVSLDSICSKIGSGSTPKGSDYSTIGIPFFRSQNVYNEGLVMDDIKYISLEMNEKMKGTQFFSNDLLLNITGGSLGRCAVVPKNFKVGNVSQHVCIIRSILVEPQYLHCFIISNLFQKNIKTSGAGRQGLPKYNLEKMLLPLPPLAEQKAIISKVDKYIKKIDELEQQITTRETYTQTLLQTTLHSTFQEG